MDLCPHCMDLCPHCTDLCPHCRDLRGFSIGDLNSWLKDNPSHGVCLPLFRRGPLPSCGWPPAWYIKLVVVSRVGCWNQKKSMNRNWVQLIGMIFKEEKLGSWGLFPAPNRHLNERLERATAHSHARKMNHCPPEPPNSLGGV